MNTSCRFSIIIPTFHRPNSVLRLIEQVRNQRNASESEVIVIDDSSLTSLKAYIEEMEPGAIPVTYLACAEEGPGNARNVGAQEARGEFLIFLDDDCEVSPHWLSFLQNEMLNASADIYYGPVESKIHTYEPFIQTIELKDCPYRSTNIAFRSRLFQELGGFDPNLSHWSEGWDLVNRARRHGAQLKYAPQWACSHTPIYTPPTYFKIPTLTQTIHKMTYLMKQHRDSRDVQNHLSRMFSSGFWHMGIRLLFFVSPLFFFSTGRSFFIFLLCSFAYDLIRLIFIQQRLIKKGYSVSVFDSIKYVTLNWSEDLRRVILGLALLIQRFKTRNLIPTAKNPTIPSEESLSEVSLK